MRAIVPFLVMLALGVSACGAAPSAESEIRAALTERVGHTFERIRVEGAWAVADDIATDTSGSRKVGVVLLCCRDDRWDVIADLAGAGSPTQEALLWHEVEPQAATRLVDATARDAQRPVLTLLRRLKPARYPEGVLFETLAVVEPWALCAYRSRASLRRSDTFHHVLLRRTSGAWHVVDDGASPLDLAPYGVPVSTRKRLRGDVTAGP